MANIFDIITTPERTRIFESISRQKNSFSSKDIQDQLKKNGDKITITTIQNFLRLLHYRGYLEQFAVKTTTTRGRSSIHFKKIVSVDTRLVR